VPGEPGLELVGSWDVADFNARVKTVYAFETVMSNEAARRRALEQPVQCAGDMGKATTLQDKRLDVRAASQGHAQAVSYHSLTEGSYWANKLGFIDDTDPLFEDVERWKQRYQQVAPNYVQESWHDLLGLNPNTIEELDAAMAQRNAPVPGIVAKQYHVPSTVTWSSCRQDIMFAWALTKQRRQAGFQRHRKADQVVQQLVLEVLAQAKPEDTILYVGSGFIGPIQWKHATFPPVARRLVRELARYFQVVMVPEFRSSQACAHCLHKPFKVGV